MSIEVQDFGTTPAGVPVQIFTLTAPGDESTALRARITNYGGVLVNLWAPDRNGQAADVVLGFDTLDEYITLSKNFGCLVGRFANRIAGGRFELNGKVYQLAQNGGPNHIHGGPVGFDKVVWEAETSRDAGQPVLTLRHHSPDGDQGYPGALDVTVIYTVTADNALRIDYRATTDAPTILNLTNHTYFNLAGQGNILDHVMTLRADAFTPVDTALIPTGEIMSVADTPFDFRTPTPIGARMTSIHEQVQRGRGYDHNWVLGAADGTLRHAATVEEPQSGRRMHMWTTQPGVQFYTGNMLPDALPAKAEQVYTKQSGFCLETQHFPDSPNQPGFPSVVLEPGAVFAQTTVFGFEAE
ncbi:MAG: aldose epimerase family protein [Litorilinea sp.]